ncbi:MAG: YXWGXW repeat-containing protein [Steroidobacteraceae bacterium]
MTRNSGLSALAAILAGALAGCIVQAPYPPPAESAPPEAAPVEETAEQAPEPPPPLPDYDQPPCPEEGYLWTPGLWRWGPEGYFWVPGTWVAPPRPGVLWTPGYWALAGGAYAFHPGYWGPHVGYYGGINYGGGYVGNGYGGGRWVNNRFEYNTAVSNVNVTTVHNTYVDRTVINNVTANNTSITRGSYVGGAGTRSQPTAQETAAARQVRTPPTPAQDQHHYTARNTPMQNAGRNAGHPPVAATPHPGGFNERGVTAAKPGGPAYHPQHAAGKPEQGER